MVFCLALGGEFLQADVKRRTDEAEKKNKNPIQVPEVRAVSARFIAGGAVEVELVAVVASLRQVDFVIRQGPQHGVLSEIRRHPRETNRAIVTYTHSSKASPLVDVFTYACRLDGGPYSAPGRVVLQGQKFDPILKVHTQPAFNRIFAGGEIESNVILENVGAAPFEGVMKWEAPFYGPEVVRVPAGGKTEFKVVFRPEQAGHFRWELPLVGNHPEGVMEFYGDSIPALTVSPGRVVLKWDEKTRERSAVLTLANGRPDMVEAKLKLPLRLRKVEAVSLKPQGGENVQLVLPASDVEAFSEEIVIESAGVVERVLVTAEAQPGDLKLVSPSEKLLDFGTLKQRTEKELDFTIGNRGGQDLLVTMVLRPPFAVQESGETIRLQPGQERRFVMKVDTRAAGFFETNLELSAASQKEVLKVRATVDAPEAPSQPPLAMAGKSKSAKVNPSSQKAQAAKSSVVKKVEEPVVGEEQRAEEELKKKMMIAAVLASHGVTVDRVVTNPHLDQIEELRASEMTQSSMKLSWQQTKVKPAKWRVESASNGIKPETGMIVKFWEPIGNWVELEDAGDGMVAVSIESLRPGTQYEFRVLGVDQEGKVSKPSPSVQVTTQTSWRMPTWVWRTLIVSALGTIFYLLYRVRRGDFELEY